MKAIRISSRRWKSVALALGAAAVIGTLVPARTAHAGVSVSVGVNVPFRPLFAPPFVYAPRAVYVPPPVVYAPRRVYVTAPVVYARPARFWVAGFWECGRWVPGHWAERW